MDISIFGSADREKEGAWFLRIVLMNIILRLKFLSNEKRTSKFEEICC